MDREILPDLEEMWLRDRPGRSRHSDRPSRPIEWSLQPAIPRGLLPSRAPSASPVTDNSCSILKPARQSILCSTVTAALQFIRPRCVVLSAPGVCISTLPPSAISICATLAADEASPVSALI